MQFFWVSDQQSRLFTLTLSKDFTQLFVLPVKALNKNLLISEIFHPPDYSHDTRVRGLLRSSLCLLLFRWFQQSQPTICWPSRKLCEEDIVKVLQTGENLVASSWSEMKMSRRDSRWWCIFRVHCRTEMENHASRNSRCMPIVAPQRVSCRLFSGHGKEIPWKPEEQFAVRENVIGEIHMTKRCAVQKVQDAANWEPETHLELGFHGGNISGKTRKIGRSPT